MLSPFLVRYAIWSPLPLGFFCQGFFEESKGLADLSFRLPSSSYLHHSTILWVIWGPPLALHQRKYFIEEPFLGLDQMSPICTLPRHVCFTSLGGCCNLGLVGLGFLIVLHEKTFLMFSRSVSIVLGDSGTVL
jgi:hypothetical protein